jgi:putative ABC transport system substrate-binding protein
VRRREFIAVFGGAAAWPLAGYAQQTERMRRVGVLMHFSASDPRSQVWVTTLRQALAHLGWDQDKNIQFEYRFAAGDPNLFETYAAELVRLSPDVILAITSPAVFALREQTHAVPIVFVNAPDPVGLGIVQSLAHPGGNITGFASYDAAMIGKWLQLLKEIAPNVARVAIIFNPDTALFNLRQIDLAARSIGITVTLTPVHDDPQSKKLSTQKGREAGWSSCRTVLTLHIAM